MEKKCRSLWYVPLWETPCSIPSFMCPDAVLPPIMHWGAFCTKITQSSSRRMYHTKPQVYLPWPSGVLCGLFLVAIICSVLWSTWAGSSGSIGARMIQCFQATDLFLVSPHLLLLSIMDLLSKGLGSLSAVGNSQERGKADKSFAEELYLKRGQNTEMWKDGWPWAPHAPIGHQICRIGNLLLGHEVERASMFYNTGSPFLKSALSHQQWALIDDW